MKNFYRAAHYTRWTISNFSVINDVYDMFNTARKHWIWNPLLEFERRITISIYHEPVPDLLFHVPFCKCSNGRNSKDSTVDNRNVNIRFRTIEYIPIFLAPHNRQRSRSRIDVRHNLSLNKSKRGKKIIKNFFLYVAFPSRCLMS